MEPSLATKLRKEIKINGFAKCSSCQLAYMTIGGIKRHIDAGKLIFCICNAYLSAFNSL